MAVPLSLLAMLVGLVTIVPSNAFAEPPGDDSDASEGIELIQQSRLDDRLLELTFRTTALQETTKVRVLLPSGYSKHPKRRYPVLYLLHGGTMDYSAWTADGDAARVTEPFPVITVMPDGGFWGYYSDWFNRGQGGPPKWETVHIRQLLPWIDQHFRTIANRGSRAIAGLSMGGAGAMIYAARHPDLFVAASSYSGDVDNLYSGSVPGIPYRWNNYGSVTAGGLPADVWGLRETERVRWRDHNPIDLAPNLRGVHLTLRTGNGKLGGPHDNDQLDRPTCVWCTPNLLTIYGEVNVYSGNVALHRALVEQRIPHTWDGDRAGLHSWPYWTHYLNLDLPIFMRLFSSPPPPPSLFTYRTAESQYDVHGWQVTMNRPVTEFSEIDGVATGGLRITGSGSALVRTPPSYRPGGRYQVRLTGQQGTQQLKLTASRSGRLEIPVKLGPGNRYQEDDPLTNVVGGSPTRRYTVDLRIKPMTRH